MVPLAEIGAKETGRVVLSLVLKIGRRLGAAWIILLAGAASSDADTNPHRLPRSAGCLPG
jgi:hypothetical protein